MARQEFHYTDDKSNKFWAITQTNNTLLVEFGRIGAKGQKQIKELDTPSEAKKTAEKLIASKVKKGYVAAGDKDAPPAKAPTKKATKKATKNKTQPSAKRGKSVIALEPQDWLWATWRPRKPIPRPEPEPFDLDKCLKRLAKIKHKPGSYGWEWNWSGQISMALTPEEAHFWFVAMTSTTNDKKGKDLVKPLSKKKYSGKVDRQKIAAAIKKQKRFMTPEFLLPVSNLLSFKDLIGLLQDKKVMEAEWYITDRFLEGFQRYVIPYLDDKQLLQLRKTVKSKVNKRWPTDYYNRPDTGFHLAAAIPGMHDALLKVVQSWKDDLYQGEDWIDHYHKPQYVVLGLGSAELVQTHMRRMKLMLKEPSHLKAWLAHTELDGLDLVRDSILARGNKKEAEALCQVFALVQAPEAAPHMLALKLGSKAPSVARAWLEEHVGHAIAGLVSTAAERGRLAEAALEFLRERRRKGDQELIEKAVKKAPKDVAQKVTALVLEHEEKTYETFDDKSSPAWLKKGLLPPKKKTKPLPGWVDPADLPPVAIGDHRLNTEQVKLLLLLFRTSTLEEPAPVIPEIKKRGEAEALDAFVWKLFELWLGEGAPSKEKWAMMSIGFFGGDASALRLTPLVRTWPGESQHQRAVLGLGCLRAIGTDTALMQLNGIAQKLKFKALKQRAMEAMEGIASERGMSRSELEDRIVPDCDLDETGSRTFDFGPRSFRFVLGPAMKPMVRDDKGKVKANLPKPGKNDDAEKAQKAVAEWKLLKKQLREVVKIQAVRLEQAMVVGRRWPVKEFETLLVRHPLMINLVRLVVWGAHGKSGKLAGTFRVTEDRQYADNKDSTFKLDGKIETVGVVHPFHLAESLKGEWGQIFGDYELVSPFPQLGRPIHGLDKGEAKKKEITRFKGQMVPAVSLVGTLDKQGWNRGIPEDAGIFGEHSKPFYGAGVTAIVQYPGVPVGYMMEWEDQEIERCFFLKGIYTPQMYPDHKKALPLNKVDPVALSETLADLTLVASKAR